jgi:hypothetical protein
MILNKLLLRTAIVFGLSIAGAGYASAADSLISPNLSGFVANSSDGNGVYSANFLNAQEPRENPINSIVTGENNSVANIGAIGDLSLGSYLYKAVTGLVVGQTYQLTFSEAAANRAVFPGGNTQWNANLNIAAYFQTLNGVKSDAIESPNMASPNPNVFSGWQSVSGTLKATATTEYLIFLGQSSVSVSPEPIVLFTNASLTPTPEPEIIWMFSTGLAVLSIVKRRQLLGKNTLA